MKKTLVLFFLVVILPVNLFSQSTDKLTNSSVIRMVKANLTDKIIINEINSSTVEFDFSENSLKTLSEENVSEQVIQAMKIASNYQPTEVPIEKTLQIDTDSSEASDIQIDEIVQEDSAGVSMDGDIQEDSSMVELPVVQEESLLEDSIIVGPTLAEDISNEVELKGYVIPMKDLLNFYNEGITEMSDKIQKWNDQIYNSIKRSNEINSKIISIEKELYDKKNADSKKYSNEIMQLKNQLNENRLLLKQHKSTMFTEGTIILKELQVVGNDLTKSTNDIFNDVNKKIKGADISPSSWVNSESINVKKQEINTDFEVFIYPVTEILFFNKNEIKSLKQIIALWNIKVDGIFQKDAEIGIKMQESERLLENYKSEPKKYKSEISNQKKILNALTKERKKNTNQAKSDCNELSKYLKTVSSEINFTLKERFKDISENISYEYQEKLN